MNVTFIVPFSAPVSLAPERCHALSRIDVSPFPSKKETINLYDLRRLLRRLSITMTVLPASISLFVGASLFPRFSFFRFFLKHDNSDSLKREKKEVARRNLLASSWQESQEEGFIFRPFPSFFGCSLWYHLSVFFFINPDIWRESSDSWKPSKSSEETASAHVMKCFVFKSTFPVFSYIYTRRNAARNAIRRSREIYAKIPPISDAIPHLAT